MKIITDALVATEITKAGYTIEQEDPRLIIRKKFKVSLFVFAYVILLVLYLVVNSPSATNITIGVAILVIIMLLYYQDSINYMLIDHKAVSLVYAKGLLRNKKYANFSDVKMLELKTYNVAGSTSPFKKSNRDYIVEIRLIMAKGQALELFSFEKDNPEDLEFSKALFEALVQYTGFVPKIVRL